jgi:hypothetical protein
VESLYLLRLQVFSDPRTLSNISQASLSTLRSPWLPNHAVPLLLDPTITTMKRSSSQCASSSTPLPPIHLPHCYPAKVSWPACWLTSHQACTLLLRSLGTLKWSAIASCLPFGISLWSWRSWAVTCLWCPLSPVSLQTHEHEMALHFQTIERQHFGPQQLRMHPSV